MEPSQNSNKAFFYQTENAVMIKLLEREKWRFGDLCKDLGMVAPAVGKLLDRLQERGWVDKAREAGFDKRAVFYYLTTLGKAKAQIRVADIAIETVIGDPIDTIAAAFGLRRKTK